MGVIYASLHEEREREREREGGVVWGGRQTVMYVRKRRLPTVENRRGIKTMLEKMVGLGKYFCSHLNDWVYLLLL